MPVSRDWGVGGWGGVVSKRSGLVRSPIRLPSGDGESGAEEDIEVDAECVVSIVFLSLVDVVCL